MSSISWPPDLLRRLLQQARERADTAEIELAHWHVLFGEDTLKRVLAYVEAASAATDNTKGQRLRETLEKIQIVDYDPATHGALLDWAAETLTWLDAERLRHADQVTEIHRALTDAGHRCARGEIHTIVARILADRGEPGRGVTSDRATS